MPQMQKRDLVSRYCAFAAEAQDGIAWHSTVWHSTAVRAQGELAATAVNAPMVPAEVLAELQPFCQLAQGLGTAAVQLVGSHGFTDIHITYATSRGGAPLDPKPLHPLNPMAMQIRHPHHLCHQPRRCALDPQSQFL